ncbi:MAG: hypothetical protein QMD10_10640, partial [Desulfitobacteriaceae bacterium]|nr:hypothetical protein [Desulfitobacteriaceae bacterium]
MSEACLEWTPGGYQVRVGEKVTRPFKKLLPFRDSTEDEFWKTLEALGLPREEVKKAWFKRDIWREWNPLLWVGKNPKLFSLYMFHLNRWVQRDWITRKTVFLVGLSAYSPNPQNLFLRGPSSLGKTYVTLQTLKYFPAEDVWTLGGLSPTALAHDYGRLVGPGGVEVSKGEKPPPEAKYVINLQGKILVFLEAPPPETYRRLYPILSHDKQEITYKFTDRSRKGGLHTRTVYVQGWPATIWLSTETQYIEELATRGITLTPETGKQKYEEAIALQGRQLAFPWHYENPTSLVSLLSQNLEDLKGKIGGFIPVLPYGRELATCYPHNLPRDMRDFQKLSSLIQQCAYLHFWQRPRLEGVETEGKNVFIATLADFEMALEVFTEVIETTRWGLAGHVVDFHRHVMIPLAQNEGGILMDWVVDEYAKVYETPKSR